MDCMLLNALVTNYLLSIVCAEISDIILEDEEMREMLISFRNFSRIIMTKIAQYYQ